MSIWWFFFGIGLMGTIIAHGLRQTALARNAPALHTDGHRVDNADGLIEKHNVSASEVARYSSPSEKLRAWGLCDGESRATLDALVTNPPWLLTAQMPTLTWADVYAMLHTAGALFDEHAQIFHVYDDQCERLMYSVSKADAQGAMPHPFDHNALRVAGEPILLMLPLDEQRNANYDAFLAFASLACELLEGGGRIHTTSMDNEQPTEQLNASDFKRMAQTIAHDTVTSPAGKLRPS